MTAPAAQKLHHVRGSYLSRSSPDMTCFRPTPRWKLSKPSGGISTFDKYTIISQATKTAASCFQAFWTLVLAGLT
jgi:hypothetical protein